MIGLLELRRYSDQSRHIYKRQNGIYCLNFVIKCTEPEKVTCSVLVCRCQCPLCSVIFSLREKMDVWRESV